MQLWGLLLHVQPKGLVLDVIFPSYLPGGLVLDVIFSSLPSLSVLVSHSPSPFIAQGAPGLKKVIVVFKTDWDMRYVLHSSGASKAFRHFVHPRWLPSYRSQPQGEWDAREENTNLPLDSVPRLKLTPSNNPR